MSRRYLRPGALVGHVLVLAAALTCLRLGWWQWEVFEDAGGTGQNLGYSLLWPVFAGAFIYMWLRFLQLEGQRESDDRVGPDADDPDETGFDRDAPHDGADPTAGPSDDDSARPQRGGRRHRTPSRPGPGVRTVGVGYVGDDDDDDPELAAYNRALARLADEDERRAD